MKFRIESSSGLPITRQLVDQIAMAYASGELTPGQRLPSVRELARELAVNQNTVLRVYERLTAAGLLERRHGDGTYVADHPSRAGLKSQLKAQRAVLDDDLRQVVRRAEALGINAGALHDLLDDALAAAALPQKLQEKRP